MKPPVECTEEGYDRIFDTNAKGVFFTPKEAARRLHDGGRIIVLSTGGTRMFFPGQSLYLGSKGGTVCWLSGLGIRFAQHHGERRVSRTH